MRLCLLLMAIVPLVNAQPSAGPPFTDGEVVALVGDSITHNGHWHRYLADYYATRFPGRTVRFLNCGISGDSASGVLARLDADILVHKPTAAVVMLGMNDVGRDSYKEGTGTDAEVIARRQHALDHYQENMTKLVERLMTGGVQRLTLVTPSPYDQTARIAKENLPGVNDALASCGAFVTGLAAQYGAGVVDLNGPMTALNREHQTIDPSFTLVGADRVHPGPPGHLVMAWLFLKAQGAPALVSRIVLDTQARRVAAVEGATIESLVWRDDGVTFTLNEQALPWPVEVNARKALMWAPILDDLNRQELVVGGLAAGSYALTIDGISVGTWSAAILAKGVNLAAITTTPQALQAAAVQKLSEERRAIQAGLRSIAYVELKWFRPGTVDFTDAAATSAALDDFAAKGGATTGYYRNIAESYRKTKPEASRMWQRIDVLTGLIRETAQPVPHGFVLTRVGE